MRRNRTAVAVGAGLVAILMTGCVASGGARPTETTTTTTTTTTTPSSSASTTSSPTATPMGATAVTASPTASPRRDPNAPTGQCADAHLAVSVQNDPTGSGAGHRLSYVVFRNTGTTSCVLKGWPGVSLVGDHNGTQIGPAARQQGALQPGERPITIPAGSYALSALSYPNIDATGGAYGDGTKNSDPKCDAKKADGYRVYPPHSFRAYFSPATDLYGCSTTLQTLYISPVTAASTASDFTPKAP